MSNARARAGELILALGGVLALFACAAPLPHASPASASRASFTEGVVEAGGVSLHVHCIGQGAPTVVFDAGLGNDGSIWHDVQLEVSRITRACVYDRAGLGGSGPAPRPHTSGRMVAELHAVLEQAKIAGPHVLVGHSLGGLNMRLYAAAHGASGLVLVDAVTENQDARFWSLLPPAIMTDFQNGLRAVPEGLDFAAFRASLAEARASKRSLGRIPLVVLTHGKADPPIPGAPEELAAQMAQVWREMQAELLRLSPNSVQIVAPNSGHFIQQDAPKLVVGAIAAVVEAARTKAPLDPRRLSSLAGEGAP